MWIGFQLLGAGAETFVFSISSWHFKMSDKFLYFGELMESQLPEPLFPILYILVTLKFQVICVTSLSPNIPSPSCLDTGVALAKNGHINTAWWL